MAFDFKKEFKEFYQPKTKPSIITIPKMNYLAVRGTGDPNQENSAYKESIELLYGVAYTLKMSHKTDYKIEGFFDYVVPPLEGFWWQEDREGVDYGHKEQFSFISVIRLPDFVSKDNVDWAISQASKKKKRDFSKVEFFTYDEGLCVQCMHIGPYNDEPKTVEAMHQFMAEEGYVLDITLERMHHEIYLGDVRKTAAEKLKTVLRHPIKKV
ncbi:GyrI-like domain-containing protein [Streptococcus ratti]|uniref:Transcriptional regulator n=1 Tax=Streptococcus ratti TaxID=1341 RepID=A0A7X9QGG7_STRRT|nr:GyrI-like domain-containing protein [Streptococcus ratti]NMD48684.1 transcriptional regulator [Streptococcus ratti]